MFRPYEVWRHRNCTEIDIEVIKVTYRNPEYIKLKVRYLNRRSFLEKNRLINNRPETVRIFKKDFKNWSLINEEK